MEETVVEKIFDFGFELPLREKLETVWQFPCICPLRLCSWREDEFGALHEEN